MADWPEVVIQTSVSQMPMKKYDQIFLRKDDEKETLKECYSEPFMSAGEVETLPPKQGVFKLQTVANQPPLPDGLDLPFNLVRHGLIKGRSLTMSLLKPVNLWIHKARLMCENTRNCTLCCSGDRRLQASSTLNGEQKL